jgi:RNA polymerase sigma factor (sigma-70 family)
MRSLAEVNSNSMTSAGAGDPETVWIRQIANGDVKAFEQFYKNYYPRLYRFILRMTAQSDCIEELIQETLLVVWRYPTQFNYQSKVSTWVMGIAYRKTLKFLSKNRMFYNETDIENILEQVAHQGGDPERLLENQQWLHQALKLLSPEQRAVIDLTFYQDLSYQDIALVLGCPENTVKTRMHHARKKLQAFARSVES